MSALWMNIMGHGGAADAQGLADCGFDSSFGGAGGRSGIIVRAAVARFFLLAGAAQSRRGLLARAGYAYGQPFCRWCLAFVKFL